MFKEALAAFIDAVRSSARGISNDNGGGRRGANVVTAIAVAGAVLGFTVAHLVIKYDRMDILVLFFGACIALLIALTARVRREDRERRRRNQDL